jgi:hypothetical protein
MAGGLTMKKRIAFFATMMLTLGIGVAIGQVGKADNAPVPGSADDPIVTKSYVDQKIAAISGTVPTPPPTSGGSATPVLGIDTFKVVELKPGQVINGGEGTEFIVRAGSAEAVIGANAKGGLTDITGGTNLGNGDEAVANHMILVPRNDGRGLRATSSGTTYVMVRGNYSIQ